MVPGLAADGREAPEFLQPVRVRRREHRFAALRDDEQQRLVGQQQHLPVAVAALPPAALARLYIDATEDAAVETVDEAVVNHEVIEGRLHLFGTPALLRRPRGAVARQVEQRRLGLARDDDLRLADG